MILAVHLAPLVILAVMTDAGEWPQTPPTPIAAAEQDSAARQGTSSDQQPPPDQTIGGVFADEVVVTASRVEQMARDIPVNVTVLTADDIRRSSAQTVDELLRRIPGFSLLRQASSNAGHPTTRSAALRGLGGLNNSRTLVLLNGVPMNDPFAGVVYWSRVPLENIERIEVVKGGGSGIWGNLALGGVINIITAPAKPGQTAVSVTAEGGSGSTGRVHAAARGSRGRVSVAASTSYFRTDGYMTVREDQRGPIDRPIGDVNTTFDANLEYKASSDRVWSVGGSFYGEEQNWGTPLSMTTVGAGYLYGGGTVVTSGGGRWQLTGFFNRQGSTNVSPTVSLDRQSETLATDQFNTPATAAGASVQWSRPAGRRHLLTAGSDWQWIDATVDEKFNLAGGVLTRTRRSGGRQAFGGLYLAEILQVTPRWRVVGAARLDWWQAFDGVRREVDVQSLDVLRDEAFSKQTKWTFNPSVGVVHHASDRLLFKASLYRAFRAPTPGELYRPFRARGNVLTESNAQLSPERLTGIEGGLDASLSRGLRARITGFWDRLQDPVTTVTIEAADSVGRSIVPCGFVPAGGVCRQRQNLGQLQSRGVESEVEYRFHPYWTLELNWLFNQSRVVAAPNQPQLVGAFNKQSPVHQVVVTASYENPRVIDVSVLSRYVGERFEDDLNSLRLGGFVIADLRVSRAVSSKAEAFVAIQNLFDRTFENTRASDGTVGIGPPRLINAGLRVRF